MVIVDLALKSAEIINILPSNQFNTSFLMTFVYDIESVEIFNSLKNHLVILQVVGQ
jgi:hypothetical protein